MSPPSSSSPKSAALVALHLAMYHHQRDVQLPCMTGRWYRSKEEGLWLRNTLNPSLRGTTKKGRRNMLICATHWLMLLWRTFCDLLFGGGGGNHEAANLQPCTDGAALFDSGIQRYAWMGHSGGASLEGPPCSQNGYICFHPGRLEFHSTA